MPLREIALACALECERQRVGVDRLAMLVTGYAIAMANAGRLPTEHDLLRLAAVVEPTTRGSYRTTPVVFASGGTAANAQAVPAAIGRGFELLDVDTDPAEFVRSFLSVHPFVDGNGRLAFVLLNWLAGSLNDPQPLPDFFPEPPSRAD